MLTEESRRPPPGAMEPFPTAPFAGPAGTASAGGGSEEVLASLLSTASEGIAVLRPVRDGRGAIVDFHIVLVNGALERIIGRSAASVVGGRLLAELPGLAVGDLFDRFVDAMRLLEPRTCRQRYEGPQLEAWMSITAAPVGELLVVRFSDVSEPTRAQGSHAPGPLHDRLTGLPNRALLHDRIEHALRRRERTGGCVSLFSVDVDKFQAVNDNLGNDVGDEVLRAVGHRLRHLVRPSDTVSRMRGDRFVIVSEGRDEHAADALARRLLDAFEAGLDIGERRLSISISIGIVVSTDEQFGAQDLLTSANDALLQAKASGYGRHQFLDQRLQERTRARAHLGEEFVAALALGQFRLLYQPIVRLEDLRVTGFEALVRWEHPRHGLMSPMDFIPVAEETGFVVPLGRWILEEACRQRSEWASALGEQGEVTMAVNLSARQLADDDVVTLVKSALSNTAIPPQSLCLEVTETALLDVTTAPGTLEALAATGVCIALDDFGTGYSSVGHLRRFPVDIIKIDRAFVTDLDQPGDGAPIVAGLAALAGTLGMDSVAEGVETVAQLRAVRDLGIESAQGYLFAMPLTAEAATELLQGRSGVHDRLDDLRSSEGRRGGTASSDLLLSRATVATSGTPQSRLAERFAAQRMIVDSYPTGALTVYDTDLRYVIVGRVSLTSMSVEDMEGRLVTEVLPPALVAVLEPHYRAALQGESVHFDVPVDERTIEMRVGPIRDTASRRVIGGLVCTRDVTDERRSSVALREAQELFRTAFQNARIGMAVVALDGRYQQVNEALCHLTGYTAAELCARTFMDITHPDDRPANVAYTEDLTTGPARGNELEKRYVHALGHVVWVLRTASLVRDPSGTPLYFVVQIQDITERKEQEEALRWQAERDGLTGLWNRRRFDQELARCDDLAERHGRPYAVILLDLDKFKAVNDTLGHLAGDEVLRRVAAVMATGVRSSDVAARYGGDEFGVVLPDTSREVAAGLADRLLARIATERMFVDGRLVEISASAGVADAEAGPDVVSSADRALYHAKRARATT